MNTPLTYGEPIVSGDDILARIDALIPRDGTGMPIMWVTRNVHTSILLAARNEIARLRAQNEALLASISMIERAAAGAIYSQEAIHAMALHALKFLKNKPSGIAS